MATEKKHNPKTFQHPFDYLNFSRDVTSKFRYIRDTRTNKFLNTVLATSKNREKSLRKNLGFWRAQLGSAKSAVGTDLSGNIQEDVPYPPERMKPLVNRAKEGRANPKGIPYLYLSTKMQTAIQEIRPWLGSLITVARVQIVKALKLVDCSKNIHRLDGTGTDNLWPHGVDLKNWENGKLSNRKLEEYVWSWIDRAFSMPVDLSDDKADYVPTQILAELFKANNYDGIIFNSLFAEGKNLILFDVDSVEVSKCVLYQVTNIPPFEFQEHKRLRDVLAPTK